jgi:hypothetical protein
MEHVVKLQGQSVADCITAKCSCGWSQTLWFQDYVNASDAWIAAHKAKDEHEYGRH